jgi:hypothetical protein
VDQAPTVEDHIVESRESPGVTGQAGTSVIVAAVVNAICRNGQALAKAADILRSGRKATPNVIIRFPGLIALQAAVKDA